MVSGESSRHSRALLLSIGRVSLLIAVLLAGASAVDARTGSPATGSDSLRWSRVRKDVRALTAMRGRGYAFGGHLRAARFLRERFESLGLEPIGESYHQAFELSLTVFPREPMLVAGSDTLEVGREYVPYGGSAGGGLWTRAVTYAGHGAVLPERGVDPYPREPLQGGLVVLEERLPDSLRDVRNGAGRLSARIDTAAARGAGAVLVLTDRLIFSPAYPEVGVPVVSVLRSAWPEPPARLSEVTLRISARQGRRIRTQNVLARRPGTDVPDSTVVVSAHYDHLGCVGPHVCFPGANDNASGTAMLLRLARHVAARPARYSTVFVGFSGEEAGLFGSRYFAARPPVDLDRTSLVLNLDMVGAGGTRIVVEGGTDHPGCYAVFRRAADSLGIGPLDRRRNVPNSDHFPLFERGVTALFVYADGGSDAYHHVDDLAATLEEEVFRDVYRLTRSFLDRVGSSARGCH